MDGCWPHSPCGINLKGEVSTDQTRRPFFLPEMASWVRPVWIATWTAQVYGALVLLATSLPLYGMRLPGWLVLGVGVHVFAVLVVAAYLHDRGRTGAYGWAFAGMATMGTAGIFTAGLFILATYPLAVWETLALAAFGVFCLAFLVTLDRLGFLSDRMTPQVRRLGSEEVPWWVVLTICVVALGVVSLLVLVL